MNIQEFKKFTAGRLVFLDGATGSNLSKRGMPAGVCPEKWMLENQAIVKGLIREYVDAGSDIVYAPTFTANRIKLAEYGLEERIGSINQTLVKLAKEAADGRALVAGDLTMTGRQLKPVGNLDFEELIQIYKEQICLLKEAGVDLLVVETMMSLQETRAALIAAKEVCELPVMATLTFEADGRTLFGTDSATAAITLEKLGACAVGANCSAGPDKLADTVRKMAAVVDIPVIAKPNAGMPFLDKDGNTVYDMQASAFALEMRALAEAGAAILGGCCGTTPEYIRELKKSLKEFSVPEKKRQTFRYLTSERKTAAFDLDSPFMIVGERINPTGKKKLQAELREGKLDLVLSFAEEQEAGGAALLDINMGMSGIDEKEMMLKVLDEVTIATNLPLSIDSSHVEVIEAALRRYPGRALINSISGESEKLQKLLPLAKKYGAMFILLPLSDKGLPESLEEKIGIIDRISKMALDMGMTKEDIVVDGLVTTAAANPQAAKEVLETIRYCRENGFATTCGLSNISFGLPERSFVNTAFLTMAIQAGLTMAIANPSQAMLVNTVYAADFLLGKEEADVRYIERMDYYKEQLAKVQPPAVLPKAEEQKAETRAEAKAIAAKPDDRAAGRLYQDVLKGNRKQIVEHTKEAVAAGEKPDEILNSQLLPAINEVGILFDRGTYFLPQLISSAEAMKMAIEYLEPLLTVRESGAEMPAVVIATVKGDIHDIGKNLVALMLKNYGFKVYDLGKDVPRETIIEKTKEYHAKIIALSALMTTTMKEMKCVVDYAKEQGVNAKIMIGGAVITADYAKEIGADGYSRDAAEAVHVAKQLLGMEEQ